MPLVLLIFQWGNGLLKQTEELGQHLQAQDDILVKMEEERKPLKQTAGEKLEILDVISEVRRPYWLLALKECLR